MPKEVMYVSLYCGYEKNRAYKERRDHIKKTGEAFERFPLYFDEDVASEWANRVWREEPLPVKVLIDFLDLAGHRFMARFYLSMLQNPQGEDAEELHIALSQLRSSILCHNQTSGSCQFFRNDIQAYGAYCIMACLQAEIYHQPERALLPHGLPRYDNDPHLEPGPRLNAYLHQAFIAVTLLQHKCSDPLCGHVRLEEYAEATFEGRLAYQTLTAMTVKYRGDRDHWKMRCIHIELTYYMKHKLTAEEEMRVYGYTLDS